jgi:hypothetical protein
VGCEDPTRLVGGLPPDTPPDTQETPLLACPVLDRHSSRNYFRALQNGVVDISPIMAIRLRGQSAILLPA